MNKKASAANYQFQQRMQEQEYEDEEYEDINKTSDPGRKKLEDDDPDYDHVSHEHTHSNSSDEENHKKKKRGGNSKSPKSKLPAGTKSEKKLGGKGGFELQQQKDKKEEGKKTPLGKIGALN
jgi:hypothetical protein